MSVFHFILNVAKWSKLKWPWKLFKNNENNILTLFLFTLILFVYWQNWSDVLVIYHVCLYWLSMMERVFEQNAQQNLSVQHVVLPIPFVNMDPNNLSAMYIRIMYVAEQGNTCGWSCIYHIWPSTQRKCKRDGSGWPCSPLNGVVFRLGGLHSLLRPWVLPVQLWLEMVPMNSA